MLMVSSPCHMHFNNKEALIGISQRSEACTLQQRLSKEVE